MPDESYYKERDEEKSWPKIALIVLGIIILILIVFLLVRGCGKSSANNEMERDLLQAGKEYYNQDSLLLPQATGECKSVTLGTLIEEKLINGDKYSTCNQDKTYVKVCKLESGSYHYVPVMQCGNTLADDNFKKWQDGTESDLVADKSDVRFTFKGEALEVSKDDLNKEEEAWLDELDGVDYKTISSTKYYRYRDLTWKWNTITKNYYPSNATDGSKVNEYYASAPSNSYTNSEGQTEGYKWYTSYSIGQVWQSNGTKPTTSPYVLKYICYDGQIKAQNETCPAGTTTFSGSGTGYKYLCVSGGFAQLNESCSSKGSEWKEYGRQYTCDGTNIVSEGTKCAAYCKSGYLNNEKTDCGSMVQGTGKKYYPSGSTDASGEKTYYVSSPVSGAQKDEATKATVAKYFKTITSTTSKYFATAPSSGATKVGDGVWANWSDYQTTQPKVYTKTREIETRTKVVIQKIKSGTNVDNWKAITDDFVSEEELINKFKELGYDVNTLDEIEKAADLRYQVKLEYRNRK